MASQPSCKEFLQWLRSSKSTTTADPTKPGGVCYHAKIDVPSQIALKIWDEGSGPGILRPLVERIEKMGKRLLDDGLHYVRYAFHLDCLEICVECGTSSGLYKSEFHSFIEWVKVFDLEGPVA